MKKRQKEIKQALHESQGSVFSDQEIAWLKKHGMDPERDKFIILAPIFDKDGPELISDEDRKMAEQIREKVPGLTFVELSKTDSEL